MRLLGSHPRLRRALVGLAALGGLALLATAAYVLVTSDSRLAGPRPSRLLLDRHGRYLGEVPGEGEEMGYWPLPAALPRRIVVATLETEDRHFYEHGGVRWRSLLRAAWQNLKNRRIISGGSTVPMQVARMQHPASRSLFAKLREIVNAELLVGAHGHDLVLRQYLKLAPYGNRARGVVRAARLYFDKPVEDLSWLQAAFLAALPQQPGRMSPYTELGQRRALRRARRILATLRERGLISEDELRVALGSQLGLVPLEHREPDAMHAVLEWSQRVSALPDQRPIVRSTIDLELQRRVGELLRKNLRRLATTQANASAAVVTDVSTGELLAYVGSQDYFDAGGRGAIDYLRTRRSPGSALKPFIYALALERQGHTAASELPDVPVQFETYQGGAFVPENITHNFLGPMLLRDALGNSRNIPVLRLLSEVGIDRVVSLLERGGVGELSHAPERYGLSLAIGGLAVTPLELAVLYSALANQGETRPLRYFLGDGESVPAAAAGPSPVKLFAPDAAQLVTHILADADARQPGFPRGNPMEFDYAVAAKTGTSQGYRDAWAVGFSDRLLAVVWLGAHDARRMNQVTGATGAAPALHAILDAAMPLREPHRPAATAFSPPASYTPHEICPLSGKRPGPLCEHHRTEWFAPGSQPTATCPYHVEVAIDVRNGLRADPRCPKSLTIKKPMLALGEEYAEWARKARLELAPVAMTPLCAPQEPVQPKIAIREPRPQARYLFDPDTPREYSTVRLAATVTPSSEEIVWVVDEVPIARVPYPHEARIALLPGRHVIRAAFASRPQKSGPVAIVVDD